MLVKTVNRFCNFSYVLTRYPYSLILRVTTEDRDRVVFTDASLIAEASFLKGFTHNRNILLAVSYFHHHGNEL